MWISGRDNTDGYYAKTTTGNVVELAVTSAPVRGIETKKKNPKQRSVANGKRTIIRTSATRYADSDKR